VAEAAVIAIDALSTEVLLNPRMPEDQRRLMEGLVRSAPALEGHVWMASSGSSGALKMIALSKKALLASAAAVNAHLQATSADRWCRPLPSFHVGGLGIHARALLTGSEVDTLETWSPEAFAATGATLSSLVPAQLHDLVRLRLPAPRGLRAIVIGGAALSTSLYADARALGWNVLPSYGMTECCSQIATAAIDALNEDRYPELYLLNHLQARTIADGRFEFAGASLLTGYATAKGFVDPKRDGWFTSEDYGEVAVMNGRTVLRPRGRSSDFVKIGGELTSMARLDDILRSISIDAALIAVPDQRLGSVIHLVVEDSSEAAQIQARFNELVLPFERARAVHVAAIPRSPLGKLLREDLRQSLIK
jgi:O-succinylbenzoic acid--CoA ligase